MVTFENVLARISGELMVGFFGKGPVLTKKISWKLLQWNEGYITRRTFMNTVSSILQQMFFLKNYS